MSTAGNGAQQQQQQQTKKMQSVATPQSVTPITNGQTPTQSTTPPANNAPKYGTLVPNRVFVGGISATTTEAELLQLFSAYGTVKAAKIISDRAGVSKGYGFVTFESEEEARRLQKESDNIVLRERKLNIAPAIKKQPFSRPFEAGSPPAVAGNGAQAQYFFPTGGVPYYQGGVAYYPQPNGQNEAAAAAAAAAAAQQQQTAVYQPAPAVYPQQSAPPQAAPFPPVMFPPQHIYLPPPHHHHQYPYQPMPCDYGYYGHQYMVNTQNGPASASNQQQQQQQQQQQGVNGTHVPPSAMHQSHHHHHQQQQQQQQQQHHHQSSSPAAAAAASSSSNNGANASNTQQQQCLSRQHGYYNHQAATATYNPDAGMFYTMPVYPVAGLGHVEGGGPAAAAAALYTQQDGMMEMNVVDVSNNHHQQQQQHKQQHRYGTLSGVLNDAGSVVVGVVNTGAMSANQLMDAARHSNNGTPVVSILSLNERNERDYRSMQSGRRPALPVGTQQQQPSSSSAECDMSQCRTWSKKRRNYNCGSVEQSRSCESSSMSSLRTDSNSSAASAVDENLNEKQRKELIVVSSTTSNGALVVHSHHLNSGCLPSAPPQSSTPPSSSSSSSYWVNRNNKTFYNPYVSRFGHVPQRGRGGAVPFKHNQFVRHNNYHNNGTNNYHQVVANSAAMHHQVGPQAPQYFAPLARRRRGTTGGGGRRYSGTVSSSSSSPAIGTNELGGAGDAQQLLVVQSTAAVKVGDIGEKLDAMKL